MARQVLDLTLSRSVRTAVASALFVLALPFLYIVEIFWKIRFATLGEERIGHLVMNVDIFLRRQALHGRPDRTTFIFVSAPPANNFFMKVLKRRVFVVCNIWAARFFLGCRGLLTKTRFFVDIFPRGCEHEELSLAPVQFSFAPEEEEAGRELLRRMGIGPDDWFVCVHVRSSAYLAQKNRLQTSRDGHEYRGCTFDNYADAIRFIVEKGGFVLRMGATVDEPMPDLGPRVVDYAKFHRTEFGDIYLPARCRFFLGCTSGLNSVAYAFGVPLALANFMPVCSAALGRNALYIPKLRIGADRSPETFLDWKAAGLMDWPFAPQDRAWQLARRYMEESDRWPENHPSDVLGLAQDMWDRLNGVEPDAGTVRMQDAFRALYGRSPHNSPYAGRIGPRFIRKYRQLLYPDRLVADEMAAS